MVCACCHKKYGLGAEPAPSDTPFTALATRPLLVYGLIYFYSLSLFVFQGLESFLTLFLLGGSCSDFEKGECSRAPEAFQSNKEADD